MSHRRARGRPCRAPRRARRSLGASFVACAALTLPATPLVAAAPATAAAGAAGPRTPGLPDETGNPPSTLPAGAATVIEGYRGEYVHEFVVPAGRQPAGDGSAAVTFNLPDLVTDVTVSAKLNGDPIGSWLLGDGPATVPIEMALPTDSIEPGVNVLRLATITPLSIDGSCPDSRHPARWIEILGEITTDVPVIEGALPALTAFPEMMRNDTATTTIVVGGLDAAHLTAASILGAAIAVELGREHTFTVAAPGDEATGTTMNLSISSGPSGITVTSNALGLPVVDVDAGDAAELVELATALAQPGARSRMTGSSIDGATVRSFVSSEPAVPVREAGTDWLAGVTLDDLGYGPTTLEGPGIDRANYSFDLPLGDISSFMTVTVDAAATAGGADWSPAVDVYINGRLVGNGTLGDQLDSFEVEVPTQLLRPGTNFIRLEADLGSGGGCSRDAPPTRRIDIMGTTSFRLRHGSPIAADLDDLPYLLRSSTDTAATAVITPSAPTTAEASRAVQLAVLLGGRGAAATILTADEDAAAPIEARHLVIFGTADRQPRLGEYARVLPLGGSVPERWPADIEIQLGGVRHGASIQLGTTESEGVLLAVVAERDSDAIAGVDVLLDPDLRGRLVGTMALASAEPLGAVSVRYEGAPIVATDDDGPSMPDGVDAGADSFGDRDTPASAEMAPASEADRAPAGRRNELIVIALGIAVLAGGVIALRRFGITRPVSSSNV